MSNRPYIWKGNEETHAYDDLLLLPHYVSPTRPRMAPLERAAQFSPFDALEGYREKITETSRQTSPHSESSESQREEQSCALHQSEKSSKTITRFKFDQK